MTAVTTVAAVSGGTVVTPGGVRAADVLIRHGRIAAVSEPGGPPGPGDGSSQAHHVRYGSLDMNGRS